MPFSAKFNKGGFKAGFNAGDTSLIDVGFLLLAKTGFYVEIVQLLAIDQGDSKLFGLSGVN